MKKFEVFTKDELDFIPANVCLIKNVHGWMFLFNDKAQWFVNHTQDGKELEGEEKIKFIKKDLMKAIKQQMKLV